MKRATKKKSKKPALTGTKTYLIEHTRGKMRRVTVPASWKITYGPAAQGSHLGGENPFVLRFYEGQKEHLRALFRDVVCFRDTSLHIEEQVERVQAETLYRNTPSGKKEVVMEGRVKEWINPDKPTVSKDQEFINQPAQLVVHKEEDEDVGF